MKRKNKVGLVALIVIILAIVGITVGNHYSRSNETITVGSKDFTEGQIVSEIYALGLEDHGYKVTRKSNIASSVIPEAIKKGEIDLYPEYTGTALLTILKAPMATNPEKVAKTVKEGLTKQGKITTLDYASGNDSQGIAIKTSIAKKYNIYTISDLQKNADKIRFASQGEFDERTDGLKGLATKYGAFNFKSSKVYDNALKYKILKSNQADATPAYTTEGQLADTGDFTVLKDNKNFWPPYNLVPIIRQDTLKKNPKIGNILNQINKKLDTGTLRQLNKQVDLDGEKYQVVAKKFYKNNY
ncbi:glycine betaine ABC transporter substrate-binding protein [uncultured Leuconostoc sp.]|uniref:glycine betaine ABC transporter substrate-binding protein n=1 Tax=uncultured Leuconostoc sp. TaxID=173262 RepID=UPI0025F402FE|nr:glycine betaine ABC transporter substrate-binding protein [uncultured Leuconostoc sp.]